MRLMIAAAAVAVLSLAGCDGDPIEVDMRAGECTPDEGVDASPVETACRAYSNCSVNCRIDGVECHDSCWQACVADQDEETCYSCKDQVEGWVVWPPLRGLGVDRCDAAAGSTDGCTGRLVGDPQLSAGDVCEANGSTGRCRQAFDCCDSPSSRFNECLFCQILQGGDGLSEQYDHP